MDFLKGDTRVVSIKVGGIYVPIGCETENSFNESVDMLPSTTREANGWKTSRPTNQSYIINFLGLQIVTPVDDSFISYDNLKVKKRNRELIEWRIEGVGQTLIDFGTGYISSVGESSIVGELITFECEIEGYGEPTSEVDTEPPSKPYLKPFDSISGVAVIMSWEPATDNIGVVSYNIYRNDLLYDTVGNVLTYSDISVIGGFFYTYHVSAVDAAGNEGSLSNKRITPIIPSTPGADYILFEDGENILDESGVALIFE